MQTLSNYQLGYKAYGTPEGNKEYEEHFSGVKKSHKPDDWFNGFHDALDDSAMNAATYDDMGDY